MRAAKASSERSYERITRADLARLGAIAAQDRLSLFERKPDTGRLYRGRLLAVVLCQGAGLHYVDGRNGVKDFDVWSFYRAHPERPFPYRRNATADFGDPKFGVSPGWEWFVGRRVDLIGRSLRVPGKADVVETLRAYLRESRTMSARLLAMKGMVLIEPGHLLGTVVWPADTKGRGRVGRGRP